MNSKYEKFLSGYYGKTVVGKHGLNDMGIWEVKGEDSNCDMGGSHYMPTLAFLQGTLKEVIEVAVELYGFWVWGSGGNILKVNVQSASDLKNISEARKKKEQLERELTELKDKYHL